MTKIKTQLVYLSKRDAALTPGRLDTSVTIEDSESGAATDTLLAPASANTMSVGLASMPEEDWRIVADQSPDPDERALAKRRINEIQLIRLAVGQVNGEQDNSELIAQVELELYGHYTERLYYDALFQKIAQIESLNLPLKIPGLQEARAELLDRLYEILPNDYSETAERHNPSQKTIQAIKEWIDGQFEDVFEFVDHFTNDELGAEDIKKVFDMCIDTTPVLRQMGWSCQIVDREKGAISVYAADKNYNNTPHAKSYKRCN